MRAGEDRRKVGETLDSLPTRIVNGIEWFHTPYGDDCQCARCGSSCRFITCQNCGGEGATEDEDWQWAGDYQQCDWCRGDGGWYACLSGREWCQANPMKGREDQPCTASDEDDD